MASKTINDKGAAKARYEIDRESLAMTVVIKVDGDRDVRISLSKADVMAAGTAQQRAAAADWFDNAIYGAALAKAGFAG